jgi:hypothetical protein
MSSFDILNSIGRNSQSVRLLISFIVAIVGFSVAKAFYFVHPPGKQSQLRSNVLVLINWFHGFALRNGNAANRDLSVFGIQVK